MARRKPTPEEAAATRQANLDKLSAQLEEAVDRLTTSDDWVRALTFAAQFRSRSFNNTLLIWAQHLDAYEKGHAPDPVPTYVAGYVDWSKLGRHPIAGRSYLIYSPVIGRFASTNPSDPASWRRLTPKEKPKPGETVRRKMTGVKPAHVWEVSQTNGDPVPERPMPKLLEGQAPAGLWEGLGRQVSEAGFALSSVASAVELGGANGMTDYSARTVQVRADMDDAARVKTLIHELAHVRMHEPGAEDRPIHRGIGEVEAESVALMVGAAYGMDTSQYTIPYVASWSTAVPDADPLKVIRDTGERVRRTALEILDKLPTPEAGDGYPPGLDRDAPDRERSAPSRQPADAVRALAQTPADVTPIAGGLNR
ncbi:serine/arginine repetitive matrix protein 2 [Microbacterium rhizophilus]|uniref:serine/arginine repetitive matrix protein 2 n=1 Tax=Microbacterium rhizophilus TaxID=3138934 RepID=UPI0031F02EF1